MKDKNGSWLMVIYCLRCSGGFHDQMNKKTGKGQCHLIKKEMHNSNMYYDFKCDDCGYTNHSCNKRYVTKYAR